MLKCLPFTITVLLGLCISSSNCSNKKVEERPSFIVDADTANEVDDLFAIVRAVVEPSINLLGITSAQFHISPLATDTTVLESQKMNEDILRLMQRPDIPLPIGSNTPISDISQPAISEASSFIVEQAHEHTTDHPLHLVILGSCTNVASAILQDPSIIPNIRVHYLGFWHDPATNTYDKKEFNSGNDTIAVDVLLNAIGLDFDVMTATTSQHLVFKKSDVDAHLKGRGGISDYLVDRWEIYERWWTEEDPDKLQWIMWDVAIVEALIHPELAIKETFMTPPENTKRFIKAYTLIEVESMIADFWSSLERL